MIAQGIISVVGLTIANFTYQALFSDVPDYLVATERSYFMAVGILVYFLVDWSNKKL